LPPFVDVDRSTEWDEERNALLGRRISELGLQIRGSRVERLVDELYKELATRAISFRPPVYLSDQWGCPDGTPLIGLPFYLVDRRLEKLEEEMSGAVEDDAEAMRYLRHECGHAINYVFHLYDREDWRRTFGSFSRPYRERYRADPFSRAHVRHILGWYAQKHPDEDFAETFAVWLTPGLDWRGEYADWPAIGKLEYVDRVMAEVRELVPEVPPPTADDLPVESMHYTIAEHYDSDSEEIPIGDARQFDADLRRIFAAASDAPSGMAADEFIRRHYREMLVRLSYWTGETPAVVRSLLDHLITRARVLALRVSGLEATTLIELTAFGTAVVMNYRHTQSLGSPTRAAANPRGSEVRA
jgi:Putative zinc-binding metallo-peptidase